MSKHQEERNKPQTNKQTTRAETKRGYCSQEGKRALFVASKGLNLTNLGKLRLVVFAGVESLMV
jgi:hypothetical protein